MELNARPPGEPGKALDQNHIGSEVFEELRWQLKTEPRGRLPLESDRIAVAGKNDWSRPGASKQGGVPAVTIIQRVMGMFDRRDSPPLSSELSDQLTKERGFTGS